MMLSDYDVCRKIEDELKVTGNVFIWMDDNGDPVISHDPRPVGVGIIVP